MGHYKIDVCCPAWEITTLGMQAAFRPVFSCLLGLKNHGGDQLARWLPAENQRISLLTACWGSRDPCGLNLVSRSHCHYIITTRPVLVPACRAHRQTPHLVSRSHHHYVITDRCWHCHVVLIVGVDDDHHFLQKIGKKLHIFSISLCAMNNISHLFKNHRPSMWHA